jgi:hypothetical protein
MGLLHRLFVRRTAEVWRAEARLLHRLGYVRPPEAVQWISTSVCDLAEGRDRVLHHPMLPRR